MLREQVITEWTNLKEQITKTFEELKRQILTSNNPEVQQLENQILAQGKEIAFKEEQMRELRENSVEIIDEGEEIIDVEKQQKIANLEAEIAGLIRQKSDLREKLEQISPLMAEITKLNYLYSLENSLEQREIENSQYLARIERAEEKWGTSEQKLELIRDLLSSNRLTRLTELYKLGKI